MATAKKTTETKKLTLVQKMIQVSKNIGFIEFDKKNAHFNYGYASAAGMIKRFNKEFAEIGILCTVESESCTANADGTYTSHMMLAFRDADSTEVIYSCGIGSGKDSGDKGPMKASTSAFKYCLSHPFMLGWAADDPEDSKGDASVQKATEDKTLLADISKAKTQKELTALRPRVSKLKAGSAPRNQAVAAFKAKEEELK